MPNTTAAPLRLIGELHSPGEFNELIGYVVLSRPDKIVAEIARLRSLIESHGLERASVTAPGTVEWVGLPDDASMSDTLAAAIEAADHGGEGETEFVAVTDPAVIAEVDALLPGEDLAGIRYPTLEVTAHSAWIEAYHKHTGEIVETPPLGQAFIERHGGVVVG